MSDDRSQSLHATSPRSDSAEQQRLVEEGHRRVHLERTPGQFVLTLSDAGRITHAIGLDTVLGHAPRAWIGQHVEGLLDRRVDADELLTTIRVALAEGGRWTGVQGCARADGSLVDMQLFATPRVDPATHAPAGCYLSGIVVATTARRDTPATIPTLVVDRRPMVLVADDDAQMRDTLRNILERSGYGIMEASSGREALDAMRGGVRPQFLIADLRMADGSGGWLVSQVAYEFPLLLTRTVVIAGDAAGTAAAHVASRWRCPVLAKPFNGRQLVSTLSRLEGASADVA